ncbi:hypothetical protein [uncultured Pseudoteredinibacter sp.]|uniref:hypothetical protein n=1 Tax=uncultured Pseudoteredinibacter sp. TaxID=1641701 RepID=UPI002620B1DA|nr:hypothetical protein [uncultured Pseudoteredinibacter sp.]
MEANVVEVVSAVNQTAFYSDPVFWMSALAASIALLNWLETKKSNRAKHKPLVGLEMNMLKNCFEVDIRNVGLGPAEFTRVQWTIDGKKIPRGKFIEAVEALFMEYGIKLGDESHAFEFSEGAALSTGEKRDVLKVFFSPDKRQDITAAIARVDYDIEYHSVLKQKATVGKGLHNAGH